MAQVDSASLILTQLMLALAIGVAIVVMQCGGARRLAEAHIERSRRQIR
ncbi:MAG: hypothetical protein PS018_04325 [bacterium]|nr:hypothetical protein [bacterium]